MTIRELINELQKAAIELGDLDEEVTLNNKYDCFRLEYDCGYSDGYKTKCNIVTY